MSLPLPVSACHRCDVCGKLLSTKLTLKRHKEQQHLQPLNNAVCTLCNKVFRTLNSLNNHRSIYHRRQNPRFSNRGSPKKVFPCQLCGKVLCSKASLKRHIADKHAERQEEYRCMICERVAVRPQNQVPTKYRNGTETYVHTCLAAANNHGPLLIPQFALLFVALACPVSSITYRMPPPTSGGINEPQECPYCRRTFSCYYSLKRHFQDKHEQSDTLYVCEFCHRRYRTKNSLTTHKSLQHRGSSGMLKRLLKTTAIKNVLTLMLVAVIVLPPIGLLPHQLPLVQQPTSPPPPPLLPRSP
ncbi:broad [Carabus blaptoides fortunei]